MTDEIELRQQNPEQSEKMAQFESADGEDVCASYVSRNVASELGEFATLEIIDDASVSAELDGISGSNDSGNYAIYETPGGHVTGMYIARDLFDGEEPPSEIGMRFTESDEESFEEAREAIQEEAAAEAEGLLADSDDDEDKQEVQISDEELNLVDE